MWEITVDYNDSVPEDKTRVVFKWKTRKRGPFGSTSDVEGRKGLISSKYAHVPTP